MILTLFLYKTEHQTLNNKKNRVIIEIDEYLRA